jgi:hypothetical protein
MAAHPLLARLGDTVKGHKCGWAELMYVESEAMFAAMVELMRAGVPSLAVHDSIIVPISKHHLALGALGRNYRKFTTAAPALKSHRPEGLEFPASPPSPEISEGQGTEGWADDLPDPSKPSTGTNSQDDPWAF